MAGMLDTGSSPSIVGNQPVQNTTKKSVHNPDLRAERGIGMKMPIDKITKLLCRNLTVPPDADAAGVSYHLTDHVLGLTGGKFGFFLSFLTNRPLGDIVRPHVGSHARRGFAVAEMKGFL